MRKQFDCGHIGKGKYCHRCQNEATENRAPQVGKQASAARDNRDRTARIDVIDLSALEHLPSLQDKARSILVSIAAGTDYRTMQGKKLKNCQGGQVMSIPVGGRFRLLFLNGSPPTPLALYTHEEYSHLLQCGGRRLSYVIEERGTENA